MLQPVTVIYMQFYSPISQQPTLSNSADQVKTLFFKEPFRFASDINLVNKISQHCRNTGNGYVRDWEERQRTWSSWESNHCSKGRSYIYERTRIRNRLKLYGANVKYLALKQCILVHTTGHTKMTKKQKNPHRAREIAVDDKWQPPGAPSRWF